MASDHFVKRFVGIAILLTAAALGIRLFFALGMPNDEPGDARIYARIARNVIEHHSYSIATEEPYTPTYARVPGYPLFLAAVYRVFGEDSNRAVRALQAMADTVTCLMVALLAYLWAPARDKKRMGFLIGLALAAVCPFVAIYVSTILTETLATMFVCGCVVAGTLAIQAEATAKGAAWLAVSGLWGGIATMMRPDSALFLAATFAVVMLVQFGKQLAASALIMTCGFAVAVMPWAIRNARLFRVFQPLAPSHASMPGEFVHDGYNRWLRTWVDDERYVDPFEWAVDERPIDLANAPDAAFDTVEERERVAALFDQYNQAANDADQIDEKSKWMTPDIDAQFGRLAQQRVCHHPIRYYLLLPAKRAVSLWFDTHSQYYPFAGELFPLSALRNDQQVWLPLFLLLVWIYTVMAGAGAILMWRTKDSRKWVVLLVLLILPRMAGISSLENPEGRYTVEFFPFVAASAAIFAISAAWPGRSSVPTTS
jgi:dolichyl-phosphate-mannose-protein mannosyltransferase